MSPSVTGKRCFVNVDQAGVGVDLDDQRLLAAVAALVDFGQAQVNRFDARDFDETVCCR